MAHNTKVLSYLPLVEEGEDVRSLLLQTSSEGRSEVIAYLATYPRFFLILQGIEVFKINQLSTTKQSRFFSKVLFGLKSVSEIREVYSKLKVEIGEKETDLLQMAINHNKPPALRFLLERTNPKDINIGDIASSLERLEIIKILLEDGRVNPSVENNEAIIIASLNGYLEIVSLLMNYRRSPPTSLRDLTPLGSPESDKRVRPRRSDRRPLVVDPSTENNLAIRKASRYGHLDVVCLLLVDKRVDSSAENNEAIRWASKNGHYRVVRFLLMDDRVDPSDEGNQAIREASELGHVEVVRLLLKDKRVNPSSCNDQAVQYASGNGHYRVVDLLLSDKRVDPSSEGNRAIRAASDSNYPEIVRLLLGDSRVNPLDGDSEAIKNASGKGYLGVVRALLTDTRVKFSIKDGRAVGIAAANGQKEIADLLLKTERENQNLRWPFRDDK